MTPVFALMFGRLLNAFFAASLEEEIRTFVFVILGVAGAAGLFGARLPSPGLILPSGRFLHAALEAAPPTCARQEEGACGLPRCPSAPAGTLQFACLIWAGSRQANRVRRLYLTSLLSQVRRAPAFLHRTPSTALHSSDLLAACIGRTSGWPTAVDVH